VQGVSSFWNSDVTVTTNPSKIKQAIWSPCNKFIAISPGHSAPVDIMDSATLQPLQSLKFSHEMSLGSAAMAFSPDSRTLTSLIFGHYAGGWFVVSWDLQTGGVIGDIEWRGARDADPRAGEILYSITYSTNGKLVAILSTHRYSATIAIYDIASGVYTHDVYHRTHANPDLDLGPQSLYKIWTDGELLRFAIPEPEAITIWEVGFTPGATLVEVETISIPDNIVEMFPEDSFLAPAEFHPPSCRLAFLSLGGPLVVWDARASKTLLHDPHHDFEGNKTFSSDGRFFAYSADSGVHIWEESSNVYSASTILAPNAPYSKPLFSPNGESIIALGGFTTQLWHTKSITLYDSPLAGSERSHLLEFHPDQPLAFTASQHDSTVTVVDLNTGVSQLTIDTSVNVRGLRSIGNTIAVIDYAQLITWNLSGWKFPPDPRLDYKDSTRTIYFDDSPWDTVSISLDFQYIGLSTITHEGGVVVVYCISTGKYLRYQAQATALWFAPGGHDLWCATEEAEATVLTITQDTLDHTKTVPESEYGTWGCPWGSSCGYQVTSEGWVLRQDGKRLLMLPPLWRSSFGVREVAWNGKFLALLHKALPEPVILELEP
jgi:hypothetical protein